MKTLVQICQIIVGCGLLNVWLLRFNKRTAYRGGLSANMSGEFAAYGLPGWSCYFVGFLKVASALALLAGLLYPPIVLPAAAVLCAVTVGSKLITGWLAARAAGLSHAEGWCAGTSLVARG